SPPGAPRLRSAPDSEDRHGPRCAGHPAPRLRDGDAPVALPQVLDARERPRESGALVERALAERAAGAVAAVRIQAGQPERIQVLQLLERERVVDLGEVDIARDDAGLGERLLTGDL